MKIKHALAAVAVALTSFTAAPAMAALNECYSTKGGAEICRRWMDDGEFIVAIADPDYRYPHVMYLTCWDDGDTSFKSYGPLDQLESERYAKAICEDV